MSRVVLDASALLATLNDETGADRVAQALPDAVMSAVNLSVVVRKLADAGVPSEETHEALDPLGIDVVPFDAPLAHATGELRPKTRSLGLSLADRACLALGAKLKLPVLTSERSWQRAGVGVSVELVR